MKQFPLVVLVGRMNVGKSTLFNCLSTSVKSMALEYAGITRDFVRDTVQWHGRNFELVDTGGLTFKRAKKNALQEKIQEKSLEAVAQADLVIMVCDGSVGVVAEDRDIVRFLQQHHKRFLIALNKMDVQDFALQSHEFTSLGAEAIVPLSAVHKRGIEDLLDSILERLPMRGPTQIEQPHYTVTLLGRPNVGKSSLMNSLVQFERSIVFDAPGTTREAISQGIRLSKEHVMLTDTPGLRRKSAISEEVEQHMAYSSLQALDTTDIVLLVIDSAEGGVVDQEIKLGFYAFSERYKALILIINKADIMTEAHSEGLATTFAEYTHFLKKIPTLNVSCKTGKNIGKILPLVRKVWERHSMRLPDEKLYYLFMQALERKPLMRNEQRLMVHQVYQVATAPLTIGLGVNEPAWFGPSQLAFFENIMRAEYDLVGVPIKFIVRKKISVHS